MKITVSSCNGHLYLNDKHVKFRGLSKRNLISFCDMIIKTFAENDLLTFQELSSKNQSQSRTKRQVRPVLLRPDSSVDVLDELLCEEVDDQKRVVSSTLKEYYQKFTQYFEQTPSSLFRVFCAVYNQTYVVPYYRSLKTVAKSKTVLNRYLCLIHGSNSIKGMVHQMQEDGLDYLVPICIVFNKDTLQMKQHLGKGLWKNVCNSPPTKVGILSNYILAKRVSMLPSEVNLKGLVELPITLIKYCPAPAYIDIDFLRYFANKFKGYYSDTAKIRQVCDIYHDTKRMQARLKRLSTDQNLFNEDVDKMNWQTLTTYHDRLTELIMLQRDAQAKTKFFFVDVVNSALENLKANITPYNVRILDTPLELKKEGQRMNHCVGVYGEVCKEGRNIIFSVSKNGEPYSTLQVVVDKKSRDSYNVFQVGQNYKRGNVPVEDDCKQFAKILVSLLNNNQELKKFMTCNSKTLKIGDVGNVQAA